MKPPEIGLDGKPDGFVGVMMRTPCPVEDCGQSITEVAGSFMSDHYTGSCAGGHKLIGRPLILGDKSFEVVPAPEEKACGAMTTFWPDVEACEAECCLPRGHSPANVHKDRILGEWDAEEMPTTLPDGDGAS
jgi:hypothetical protein